MYQSTQVYIIIIGIIYVQGADNIRILKFSTTTKVYNILCYILYTMVDFLLIKLDLQYMRRLHECIIIKGIIYTQGSVLYWTF